MDDLMDSVLLDITGNINLSARVFFEHPLRAVVWALDRGLSAAQTLLEEPHQKLPLLPLRKTPSISPTFPCLYTRCNFRKLQ